MERYLILKLQKESFNFEIRKAFSKVEDFEKEYEVQDIWKPIANEKIYFSSACKVPRFKVREVGKEENFSVTIKIEKANTIAVPNIFKGEDAIFSNRKYWKFDSAIISQWITILYNQYGFSTGLATKYISLLKNFRFVYVEQDNGEFLHGNGSSDVSLNEHIGLYYWYQMLNYECQITLVNDHLIQKNVSYVKESAIIKYINKDNQILNEESYSTLREMANSEDDSNITTMLEIMANTNYSKSVVYLLLLLIEFKSKIYNHPTKNHVNFKSLLEYLGIPDLKRLTETPDFIFESLKRSKAYTEKNLMRVSTFYAEKDGGIHSSEHYRWGIVPSSSEAKEFDDEYECLEDEEELNIQEEC